MSTTKMFYCIVDDTALITNISEIEAWVLRGAIALVVPLHTLERLHLLKKDTSQIGQNARKAVKFLDEATSNPDVKVLIQEPDDQYQTWAQVEAHYTEASTVEPGQKENAEITRNNSGDDNIQQPNGSVRNSTNKPKTNDTLSQMVIDKMTITKPANISPLSTPPLSPSSSGPQSSKTSPDVKSATIIANDLSPVPPTLKALMNSVVWYTHERRQALKHILFLTNSSDTAYLARDFGVISKNIHQLRAAIGVEEQEAKNHDKFLKKHAGPTGKLPSEPRTLFRYEDEESSEEEVVFKPRNRAASKSTPQGRGGSTISAKSRGHGHSPANSMNGPPPAPLVPVQPKPQIPTEEIDPDSFDRGSFARGSTPLVSIGNHGGNSFNTPARGSTYRGNHNNGGSSRGNYHRGASRGLDRGSGRGRGRLFVP